ncbi:MAG: hypothetical protein J2P48_22030 [Alphaproteobacteria bacterium]|nr:hypothetical protein [Alphaproteobacteria bacterium]
MTRHTYPTAAMLGDYARAAAGFIPTVAILASMPLGAVAASVLGGFAALFAVFGIRTVLRHGTCIEATEEALRASGLIRISIALSELDRMRLSYYSTRRDRREGWMQLELRSGASRLRVDSRISGFAELVEASAKAAQLRGLRLNPATSVNLQALGIRVPASHGDVGAAAGGLA